MGLFGKKDKSADSAPKNDSTLKISLDVNGAEYTFTVEDRLDTRTSPELEAKVKEATPNAEKLVFDLGNLQYVSSAGLRVLLGAAQTMNRKGEMIVRNVTEAVREVFELTGFDRVLNIT